MEWTKLFDIAKIYTINAQAELITIRAMNVHVIAGWAQFDYDDNGSTKHVIMPSNRILEIQPSFDK